MAADIMGRAGNTYWSCGSVSPNPHRSFEEKKDTGDTQTTYIQYSIAR
jgi:hypothetical protein